MNELELLIELHKDAERQGPGSTADTLRALSMMQLDDNKLLKIADLGCGTGAQTIDIAKHTNSHILAIDLLPEFLEKLELRAQQMHVDDKIDTMCADMNDLDLEHEAYDVIWSEGAIYNIGFEHGIKQWRNYLKTGGYLAVSEITWLTADRPKEIDDYWNNAYPEIDTASSKIKLLEQNGYTLAGYFVLPASSWIDNYYKPIEQRLDKLLETDKHSELSQQIVNGEKMEIANYLKYKDYYSYGFYIARKI